jgi:hypothetical protein
MNLGELNLGRKLCLMKARLKVIDYKLKITRARVITS